MMPRADYSPLVEAARAQFESTGQVTMDRLHSAMGRPYARKTLQNVVKRLRREGAFPWPIRKTYAPGLRPNHARLIEAAREQFAATGRVTTGHLLGATGYTRDSLVNAVYRLRVRGLFPWPVGGIEEPRIAPDDRKAIAERARKLADKAVAHLLDGRSEVDDPREHGWLAEPRSVHRETAPDLAEVCRGFVAEHRRILRRQRAGHRRELVGAAPPTARSRGPPGRRGCPQTRPVGTGAFVWRRWAIPGRLTP